MPKASSTTPIRRQYLQIKQRHTDAILFFRLGDFYETFDDDAEIAARELDLVLTTRNVAKGQRVPMAGVPYHAAEGYIARLIAKGYKVAICEQMAQQPVQGIMPREVVRVVTPGTVVEPELLSEKRNNYVAAAVFDRDRAGIAYADITTGEFGTTQIDAGDVWEEAVRELERLAPAELILSDGGDAYAGHGREMSAEAARRHPRLAQLDGVLTLYDGWRFDLETARQALLDHLNVQVLSGYGCENLPLAVRAAGAIVQYLTQIQPSALTQLTRLSTYSIHAYMLLDSPTRRNLELTETLRERDQRHSLLGTLDRTLTPMGGRLLRQWIGQPLLDLDALEARLTAVDTAFRDAVGRTALRQALAHYGDLERLANRVVQAIASPRDLVGLRAALERVADIRGLVADLIENTALPEAVDVYPLDGSGLETCQAAIDLVAQAIVDEPPANLSNGGVIRAGYSNELDTIAASVAGAKAWVAGLERSERERTGIKSLKVGYNKVFGYYVEITRANTDQVPAEYIRKQTLVNAERYITPELKEKEALILGANERTLELERRLYAQLLEALAAHTKQILATARAIAHLDVCLTLAQVAADHAYVRPELATDGRIEIRGGRHPVIESTLANEPFVPNDTAMSAEQSIHIITGPNMSGKSTYLRQVALVVLLAQIGSFVPADKAHVGLVDRIFARVGAQDDISAGQSTFMVEMVELANILNHATDRSLLILDEIGRGTSTYDGISIAWAVVEYLHNHPRVRAKTLFATHYHELTELEGFLPRVANYNVAVAHQGEEVVFTHHIVRGGADRSYGIHVAQMAGMPPAVVHRAEEILADLEGATQRVPVGAQQRVIRVKQLPLFGGTHPVVEALREMDVNGMSPIEALNALYELHKAAE